MENLVDFKEIDWGDMWKAELSDYHWHKECKKDLWDKRADKFDKGFKHEKDAAMVRQDYISLMLERIELEPSWTVLDIGCATGTLAIPMAKKARSVTALDVSPEMLTRLKANAERIGLDNIKYINAAWEDASAGKLVGTHDVVVASRSLVPSDIAETLSGIIAVAGRAAYLTFPIIHLPFDWEVYRAIGRNGKKHPPYIYIYNQLYRMGIKANVEVLRPRVKVSYENIEAAVEDIQWRTDPFTPEETEKLHKFLEAKFAEQDGPGFTHQGRSQWALIWWRKEN